VKKIDRQILKTIIYADLFNYPLTRPEIWRYLIGTSKHSKFSTALDLLVKNKQLYFKHSFFSLPKRFAIIKQRIVRKKIAKQKIKYASRAVSILKYIPSVWYIGISGAVAMANAPHDDDIDFFIITSPNALWITRFLSTLILDLFKLRRHPYDEHYVNKICLNMFLSADKMKMPKQYRNLFIAHEIVQLKTLINKHNSYERFLLANCWLLKHIPQAVVMPKQMGQVKPDIICQLLRVFEKFSKYWQLSYMKNKITNEVVSDSIIKFHPHDANDWVINKYLERVNLLK